MSTKSTILNFPVRRQGHSVLNDMVLRYWLPANRQKTIAYCAINIDATFDKIKTLFPHLVLKKFKGYVSIKFPACEK